jgi:hypothetical protein
VFVLIKTRKEQKIVEVKDEIVCDICGNIIAKYNSNNIASGCPGYSEYNAHWGFGSIRDTEYYTIQICEDCSEIVENFFRVLGGEWFVNVGISPDDSYTDKYKKSNQNISERLEEFMSELQKKLGIDNE